MSKRARLFANIILWTMLVMLSILSILLYINYYPRVALHLISDDELYESIDVKKGGIVPVLPKPSKTGANFSGWYLDKDFTIPYDYSGKLDEDTELYAKFELIDYNLTFYVGDNKTAYEPKILKYNQKLEGGLPTGEEIITLNGTDYITLADYKFGYDFAGWSTSPSATVAEYEKGMEFYMQPNHVDLYAVWTPKKFDVVYSMPNLSEVDANTGIEYVNGNYVVKTPDYLAGEYPLEYVTVAYAYESKITAPENPIDANGNYVFQAWYLDKEFTKQIDFKQTYMGINEFVRSTLSSFYPLEDDPYSYWSNGSIMLYSKWHTINYDIQFDLQIPAGSFVDDSALDDGIYNNGQLVPITNVYQGLRVDLYNLADDPASNRFVVRTYDSYKRINKPSYKFAGWYTKKNGEGVKISSSQPFDKQYANSEGVVTLYAKWIQYYEISYYNRLSASYSEYLSSDYVTLGSRITLKTLHQLKPDVVVNAGYSFNNWVTTTSTYYNAGAGNVYIAQTNNITSSDPNNNFFYFIVGSTEERLFTNFTPNNYEVSYDLSNALIRDVECDEYGNPLLNDDGLVDYKYSYNAGFVNSVNNIVFANNTVKENLIPAQAYSYKFGTQTTEGIHTIITPYLLDENNNYTFTKYTKNGVTYLLDHWALLDNDNNIIKTYNVDEKLSFNNASSMHITNATFVSGNKYSIKLVGVWAKEITISFGQPTGTYFHGTAPASISAMSGKRIYLPNSVELTRDFYAFEGWCYEGQNMWDGSGESAYFVKPGDSTLVMYKDNTYATEMQFAPYLSYGTFFADSVVLNPIWKPITYSLNIYNSNKEGVQSSQTIAKPNMSAIENIGTTFSSYKIIILNDIDGDGRGLISYKLENGTVQAISYFTPLNTDGYFLKGYKALEGDGYILAGSEISVYTKINGGYLFNPNPTSEQEKTASLKAYYELETFDVTIVTEGMEGVETGKTTNLNNIEYGTLIRTLKNVDNSSVFDTYNLKQGYQFSAWVITDESGAELARITDLATSANIVNNNITITLAVERIKYNVTIKYTNPINTAQERVVRGKIAWESTLEELNLTAPEEIVGFTFKHFIDADGNIYADINALNAVVIRGAFSAETVYDAHDVEVVFNSNHVNLVDSITSYKKYGDLFEIVDNTFEVDGYRFDYWAFDVDGANRAQNIHKMQALTVDNFNSMTESDGTFTLNVYAIWVKQVKLSLEKEEGVTVTGVISPALVDINSTIVLVDYVKNASVSKLGYAFTGKWIVNGGAYINAVVTPADVLTLTEDITYMPQFNAAEVTVNYLYKYAGTDTNLILTSTTLTYGVDASVTLYTFTGSEACLTNNSNSYQPSKNWLYGQDCYEQGASFTIDKNALVNNDNSLVFNFVITLEKEYKIIYDNNYTGAPNGKLLTVINHNDIAYIIGDYDGRAEAGYYAPERMGYIFEGWSTNADGEGTNYANGDELNFAGASDIRLFAIWQAQDVEIVFHFNDGTNNTKTTTTKYDQTFTTLSASDEQFTRENYRLMDFNQNASLDGTFFGLGQDFATKTYAAYDSDEQKYVVNLYAHWEKEYTIVFKGDGEDKYELSGKYIKGESITIIDLPNTFTIADGNNFVGWTFNDTDYVKGEQFVLPDTLLESDSQIVFNVKWEISKLTVTLHIFNADETYTIINSGEIEYGQSYTLSENVTTILKSATATYKFKGWSSVQNGAININYPTNGSLELNNLTSNVELWTVYDKYFTLTYLNRDNSVLDKSDKLANSEINAFKVVSADENEVFYGWLDESESKYYTILKDGELGFEAIAGLTVLTLNKNTTLKPVFVNKYAAYVYNQIGLVDDKVDFGTPTSTTITKGNTLTLNNANNTSIIGWVIAYDSEGNFVSDLAGYTYEPINSPTYTSDFILTDDIINKLLGNNIHLIPMIQVKVEFNSNDPSVDLSEHNVSCIAGNILYEPLVSAENKYFDYWLDEGGNVFSDFNKPVYTNKTLTATFHSFYSVSYLDDSIANKDKLAINSLKYNDEITLANEENVVDDVAVNYIKNGYKITGWYLIIGESLYKDTNGEDKLFGLGTQFAIRDYVGINDTTYELKFTPAWVADEWTVTFDLSAVSNSGLFEVSYTNATDDEKSSGFKVNYNSSFTIVKHSDVYWEIQFTTTDNRIVTISVNVKTGYAYTLGLDIPAVLKATSETNQYVLNMEESVSEENRVAQFTFVATAQNITVTVGTLANGSDLSVGGFYLYSQIYGDYDQSTTITSRTFTGLAGSISINIKAAGQETKEGVVWTFDGWYIKNGSNLTLITNDQVLQTTFYATQEVVALYSGNDVKYTLDTTYIIDGQEVQASAMTGFESVEIINNSDKYTISNDFAGAYEFSASPTFAIQIGVDSVKYKLSDVVISWGTGSTTITPDADGKISYSDSYSNNHTFQLRFVSIKYTVNFYGYGVTAENVDSATPCETAYITYGTALTSDNISNYVSNPSAPNDVHAVFNSWNLLSGSITITENTNIFSSWLMQAKIVFVDENEQELTGENYNYGYQTEGSTITLPDAPEKEYHTFAGWMLNGINKGGSGATYEVNMSDATETVITFTATYSATEGGVTVKFYGYGVTAENVATATAYKTVNVTYGETIDTSTIGYPADHESGNDMFTFKEWNTDFSGEITADLNVYSTYERLYTVNIVNEKITSQNASYKVVYGESGSGSVNGQHGYQFTLNGIDTENFKFNHWIVEGTSITLNNGAHSLSSIFGESGSNSIVEIYAVYEPYYTLEFYNGTTLLGSVTKKIVNEKYSDFDSATRTGYTFDGWTLNEDGTGTVYANGTEYTVNESDATDQAIKFYAKFTINRYEVTFATNNASYGDLIAAESTNVMNNYYLEYNTSVTFTKVDDKKWTISFTAYESATATENKNVTLTYGSANYKLNSFIYGETTVSETGTVIITEPITFTANFMPEGTVTINISTQLQNIDDNNYAEINISDVATLTVNDNKVTTGISIDQGASLTLGVVFKNTDKYEFTKATANGLDITFTNGEYLLAQVDADINIVLHFNRKTFNVNVSLKQVPASAPSTEFGEVAVDSINTNLPTSVGSNVTIASGVRYNGATSFAINVNTDYYVLGDVYYKIGDGAEIQFTATGSDNYVQNGNTFTVTLAEAKDIQILVVIIYKDVTVTLKMLNETTTQIGYKYNDTLTTSALTQYTKDNVYTIDGTTQTYRFMGWTLDGSEFSSTTLTGDITLVSTWEKAYTIKFVSESGTEVATTITNKLASENLTLPTATQTGATFAGWQLEYNNAVYYIIKNDNSWTLISENTGQELTNVTIENISMFVSGQTDCFGFEITLESVFDIEIGLSADRGSISWGEHTGYYHTKTYTPTDGKLKLRYNSKATYSAYDNGTTTQHIVTVTDPNGRFTIRIVTTAISNSAPAYYYDNFKINGSIVISSNTPLTSNCTINFVTTENNNKVTFSYSENKIYSPVDTSIHAWDIVLNTKGNPVSIYIANSSSAVVVNGENVSLAATLNNDTKFSYNELKALTLNVVNNNNAVSAKLTCDNMNIITDEITTNTTSTSYSLTYTLDKYDISANIIDKGESKTGNYFVVTYKNGEVTKTLAWDNTSALTVYKNDASVTLSCNYETTSFLMSVKDENNQDYTSSNNSYAISKAVILTFTYDCYYYNFSILANETINKSIEINNTTTLDDIVTTLNADANINNITTINNNLLTNNNYANWFDCWNNDELASINLSYSNNVFAKTADDAEIIRNNYTINGETASALTYDISTNISGLSSNKNGLGVVTKENSNNYVCAVSGLNGDYYTGLTIKYKVTANNDTDAENEVNNYFDVKESNYYTATMYTTAPTSTAKGKIEITYIIRKVNITINLVHASTESVELTDVDVSNNLSYLVDRITINNVNINDETKQYYYTIAGGSWFNHANTDVLADIAQGADSIKLTYNYAKVEKSSLTLVIGSTETTYYYPKGTTVDLSEITEVKNIDAISYPTGYDKAGSKYSHLQGTDNNQYYVAGETYTNASVALNASLTLNETRITLYAIEFFATEDGTIALNAENGFSSTLYVYPDVYEKAAVASGTTLNEAALINLFKTVSTEANWATDWQIASISPSSVTITGATRIVVTLERKGAKFNLIGRNFSTSNTGTEISGLKTELTAKYIDNGFLNVLPYKPNGISWEQVSGFTESGFFNQTGLEFVGYTIASKQKGAANWSYVTYNTPDSVPENFKPETGYEYEIYANYDYIQTTYNIELDNFNVSELTITSNVRTYSTASGDVVISHSEITYTVTKTNETISVGLSNNDIGISTNWDAETNIFTITTLVYTGSKVTFSVGETDNWPNYLSSVSGIDGITTSIFENKIDGTNPIASGEFTPSVSTSPITYSFATVDNVELTVNLTSKGTAKEFITLYNGDVTSGTAAGWSDATNGKYNSSISLTMPKGAKLKLLSNSDTKVTYGIYAFNSDAAILSTFTFELQSGNGINADRVSNDTALKYNFDPTTYTYDNNKSATSDAVLNIDSTQTINFTATKRYIVTFTADVNLSKTDNLTSDAQGALTNYFENKLTTSNIKTITYSVLGEEEIDIGNEIFSAWKDEFGENNISFSGAADYQISCSNYPNYDGSEIQKDISVIFANNSNVTIAFNYETKNVYTQDINYFTSTYNDITSASTSWYNSLALAENNASLTLTNLPYDANLTIKEQGEFNGDRSLAFCLGEYVLYSIKLSNYIDIMDTTEWDNSNKNETNYDAYKFTASNTYNVSSGISLYLRVVTHVIQIISVGADGNALSAYDNSGNSINDDITFTMRGRVDWRCLTTDGYVDYFKVANIQDKDWVKTIYDIDSGVRELDYIKPFFGLIRTLGSMSLPNNGSIDISDFDPNSLGCKLISSHINNSDWSDDKVYYNVYNPDKLGEWIYSGLYKDDSTAVATAFDFSSHSTYKFKFVQAPQVIKFEKSTEIANNTNDNYKLTATVTNGTNSFTVTLINGTTSSNFGYKFRYHTANGLTVTFTEESEYRVDNKYYTLYTSSETTDGVTTYILSYEYAGTCVNVTLYDGITNTRSRTYTIKPGENFTISSDDISSSLKAKDEYSDYEYVAYLSKTDPTSYDGGNGISVNYLICPDSYMDFSINNITNNTSLYVIWQNRPEDITNPEDYFTASNGTITNFTSEILKDGQLIIPNWNIIKNEDGLTRIYKCIILNFNDANSELKSSITEIVYNRYMTSTGQYLGLSGAPSFSHAGKINSISGYAFKGCTGLTSVSLPNVTSIGSDAFYGCTGLTSISFDNVTSIGASAFKGCTGLESVSLPSVTSIRDGVFRDCTGLREVSFPVLTSIGVNEFYDCTGLESVSFPVLTSIGNYAFKGCTGLTSVSLPNVTSIGGSAFSGCKGLESYNANGDVSVDLSNVTELGVNVFQVCTKLTGIVKWSNTLTEIPEDTFYSTAITSITNVGNVTSIGGSAFSGCKGLESYNANGDVSVDLSNVTELGEYTFGNCTKLTGTVKWSNTLTEIPAGTFYSTAITSITNVGNVTSIGSGAFAKCIGLTSVSFSNVSNIKDGSMYSLGAFYNCTGLISANFPALTSIGKFAFNDCTVLESFNATKDAAGEWTHVDLSKVTNIGEFAFSGCTGLTGKVLLNNGLTEISANAFRGCNNITAVTFAFANSYPELTIGNNAFDGCTNLKKFIHDNIVSIGEFAFSGCTALNMVGSVNYEGKTAEFANASITIGMYAFSKSSINNVYFDFAYNSSNLPYQSNSFNSGTTIHFSDATITI